MHPVVFGNYMMGDIVHCIYMYHIGFATLQIGGSNDQRNPCLTHMNARRARFNLALYMCIHICSSSSSNLFSNCIIHIFTKKVYMCVQSVVSHHSHELLQLIYHTSIEYYNWRAVDETQAQKIKKIIIIKKTKSNRK